MLQKDTAKNSLTNCPVMAKVILGLSFIHEREKKEERERKKNKNKKRGKKKKKDMEQRFSAIIYCICHDVPYKYI